LAIAPVAVDRRRIEVMALRQGLDAEPLDTPTRQLVEHCRHHPRLDIRRDGALGFVR